VRGTANAEHDSDDDLRSMSWSQLRELVRAGHLVCCHTRTHVRMGGVVDLEILIPEIVDAGDYLETQLGAAIAGFCWPVAMYGATSTAEALVRERYRYALCSGSRPLRGHHDPFRVYRTNLEASWSLD